MMITIIEAIRSQKVFTINTRCAIVNCSMARHRMGKFKKFWVRQQSECLGIQMRYKTTRQIKIYQAIENRCAYWMPFTRKIPVSKRESKIKWPDVPFWPGQHSFSTCCPGVPKDFVGTPLCPVLLKNWNLVSIFVNVIFLIIIHRPIQICLCQNSYFKFLCPNFRILALNLKAKGHIIDGQYFFQATTNKARPLPTTLPAFFLRVASNNFAI